MNQIDMIVGIAALLGSLFLVTRGSRFRGISGGNRIRLALVWVFIIVALVVLAQAFGLHTQW